MKKILIAFMIVLATSLVAVAEDFTEVTSPSQIFKKGFIQVCGESEAGQSRYKAKRAAMLIAQRNLLEAVQGVHIVGSTTVSDGMLEKDEIASNVKGFLKGAIVVKEEFDSAEGYAKVAMRLNLRGAGSLYEMLTPMIQDSANVKIASQRPVYKPQKNVASLEKKTANEQPKKSEQPKKVEQPKSAEKPKAAPQPNVTVQSESVEEFDGLILLVAGTSFRPALINRILTEKQDVLFDPAKIAAPMLIERGCGGYTTTEAKAKALLKTWGCTHPLIIKSEKIMKGSEVIVTKEDAEVIFTQNQKSDFFSQAKVVFVL